MIKGIDIIHEATKLVTFEEVRGSAPEVAASQPAATPVEATDERVVIWGTTANASGARVYGEGQHTHWGNG